MIVTDMIVLRWTSGVTGKDSFRNDECVRVSIGVASIVDKTDKNILRWFGPVLRRKQSGAVRTGMGMVVEGSRRTGRTDKKSGRIWLRAM